MLIYIIMENDYPYREVATTEADAEALVRERKEYWEKEKMTFSRVYVRYYPAEVRGAIRCAN